MLGQTIWMALAIYALTGITGTLLGALASLLPEPRQTKADGAQMMVQA